MGKPTNIKEKKERLSGGNAYKTYFISFSMFLKETLKIIYVKLTINPCDASSFEEGNPQEAHSTRSVEIK